MQCRAFSSWVTSNPDNAMKSEAYRVKRPWFLPFYCSPLPLFIFIWLLMLGSLRFEISDVSYPTFSLPVMVFTASLLSFSLGYYLIRLTFWKQVNLCEFASYQVDFTRLRRLNLVLVCAALAIIGY